MAYNLEQSDFLFPNEKFLATGASVTAEGQLLVRVFTNGQEFVQPSAGVSGELVVGFSSSTRLYINVAVDVYYNVSIPSVAPYQFTTKPMLVAGQERVTYVSTGTAFTNVSPAAPSAAGQFNVNETTGQYTFNSADAGQLIQIINKRNLTVLEARTQQREGFLFNARAFETYGKVGCIQGKGYIYTDQFDVSANFATGTLTTAAGGIVTIGGAGSALPSSVRVIALPTVSLPFLGLEFNL